MNPYALGAFATLCVFSNSCTSSRADGSVRDSRLASCPQDYSVQLELFKAANILKEGETSGGSDNTKPFVINQKLESFNYINSLGDGGLDQEDLAKIERLAEETESSRLKGEEFRLAGIVKSLKEENALIPSDLKENELFSIIDYSGRGTRANTLLRSYAEGTPIDFFDTDPFIRPLFLESQMFVLMAGIAKAPKFRGPVFRAVKKSSWINIEKMRSCKKLNLPYVEPAFLATSQSDEIFKNEDFAGEVEFFVQSINGRDISELSIHDEEEKEVLFAPGSRFCVQEVTVRPRLLGGKTVIRLNEVERDEENPSCS